MSRKILEIEIEIFPALIEVEIDWKFYS